MPMEENSSEEQLKTGYTDAGVLHAASVELANLITSQHDDLGNSHPAESDTGHNVVAASDIALTDDINFTKKETTLHQVDSSKDQGVQTNSSTHASDHLGDYDLASMTTLKVDKDKLQAIK